MCHTVTPSFLSSLFFFFFLSFFSCVYVVCVCGSACVYVCVKEVMPLKQTHTHKLQCVTVAMDF